MSTSAPAPAPAPAPSPAPATTKPPVPLQVLLDDQHGVIFVTPDGRGIRLTDIISSQLSSDLSEAVPQSIE